MRKTSKQVTSSENEMTNILAFYANATPQALIEDAGRRALDFFAKKNSITKMYQKVEEIKSYGATSEEDIDFLHSVISAQRRVISQCHQIIASTEQYLPTHKIGGLNIITDEFKSQCESLVEVKNGRNRRNDKSTKSKPL